MPLGSDCVKYLSKTPKAPSYIDTWMVDSASSNLTSRDCIARLLRNIKQVREPVNEVFHFSDATLQVFSITAAIFSLIIGFYILKHLLKKSISRWTYQSCEFLYELLVRVRLVLFSCIGSNSAITFIEAFSGFLKILWLILLLVCTAQIIYAVVYKQSRWSAVSDFLEMCKIQSVRVPKWSQIKANLL